MHLHDVLRAWREEVLSEVAQTAIAEDVARSLDPLLEPMPRDALPAQLRRDEPGSLAVRLMPAKHTPNPPATEQQLDALENQLGLALPREVELLLRLHDGGLFFEPQVDNLPAPHCEALHLLSCSEMAASYAGLISRIAQQLADRGANHDDLFRAGRRFGARPAQAETFAAGLSALTEGQRSGLELLPLMIPPGRPDDLICFAPFAGTSGRIGVAYASCGFLPDHSDEYPWDGLGDWLLAMIRSRGCRRILVG